jgi:hypothetical protein
VEEMDALSIVGVALGVGVIVYALSLRGADESLQAGPVPPVPGAARRRIGRPQAAAGPSQRGRDLGFGAEPEEPAPAEGVHDPESFVYVPVLAAHGTRWTTRIGGVVGLMALVATAAMAIAVGIYQVGHVLNRMVSGFLGR